MNVYVETNFVLELAFQQEQHIQKNTSANNCFLNRNTKDFDNPDIVDELEKNNCKMIPRFDDGYKFIRKLSGS